MARPISWREKLPAAAFDTGDLYGGPEEDESLIHESPTGYLVDLVDGWLYPNQPPEQVLAVIREHSPMLVTAYQRYSVTDEELRSICEHVAECALDNLLERWEEEGLGDPAHRQDPPKDASGRIAAVLMSVVRQLHVWRCDPIADCEYQADEVERILREECPEWFEGGTGPPPIASLAARARRPREEG